MHIGFAALEDLQRLSTIASLQKRQRIGYAEGKVAGIRLAPLGNGTGIHRSAEHQGEVIDIILQGQVVFQHRRRGGDLVDFQRLRRIAPGRHRRHHGAHHGLGVVGFFESLA